MNGLIAELAKFFLSWAAVVGGVVAALHLTTGRPLINGLGAGLLAGSLGWIAVACLRVAIRSVSERAAIRCGMADAPPQEGPCVLIGHIDTSRPMLAPFDGRACVAYSYEISRDYKVGRTMSRVALYRGIGLAPSQIVTSAGAFRLLAVPTIEGASMSVGPAGATRSRAEQYLRDTQFTPRTAGAKELEARWGDTDGVYRSDVSSVTEPDETLDGCRFEQQIVPRGAQVCVFGYYSTEHRGIVALQNFARVTRLLVGNPAEASAKLASRARIQLILATVLALAATGVLAAFTAHSG